MRSLRLRVAAWFALVCALAVSGLAVAAWYGLARSVDAAAARELQARLAGVTAFIGQMQSVQDRGEIVDEFHEYAELTGGASLLSVVDPDGRVLVEPSPALGLHLDVVPVHEADRVQIVATASAALPMLRVLSTIARVRDRPYRVTIAVSTAATDALVRRFGWSLVLLVPVVLGAAMLGGYAISGRALAPVTTMSAAAAAIGVDDLGRRVAVPPTGDELEELGAAINGMLARIDAAVTRIRAFTADAAHELRTPVALIRATAEVAAARERPAAEYRQALMDVANDASRLSTLVGDLLDLARSDAAGGDGGASVEVGEVVRDAVAAVARAAGEKALALDVASAPAAAVRGAAALRRVLSAVLDNAVAYTPAGGRVSVAIETAVDAGEIRIRITDTGPGIAAVDAPRIFDRFYRGAWARQIKPEGSGLGLALASALADRAGLRLALVSAPDAPGATFEVAVPV